MTNDGGISVLKILTVFAAIIVTIYIYKEKNKWKNLTQGIKPILFGIAGLFLSILLSAIQNKIETLENILNIIILTREQELMVGVSKIVAASYIALLCGIEISLIVFIKNSLRKKITKDI